MDTVLFLSGFMAPSFASKSSWFFDKNSWNCKTIFYQSKTPLSDLMIEYELYRLNNLINSHPNVRVIGHSLGAWWAANLACRPESKIKQMVLWTPVGIAGVYPIFRVGPRHEPLALKPNIHNSGKDKSLVVYAENDLICPYKAHALPLIDKFNALAFPLKGGHLWQSNHQEGLFLMKKWLGLA